MKVIETDIEIHASVEVVWDVLTDFGKYTEWNPFITEASGEIRRGEQLKIHIEPPGARGMTFRPTVLTAERGRRLEWLGRLLVPKIFDGHHQLRIHPLDTDRVRFAQREEFSGLLVPVFLNEEATAQGFREMNEALKERAEALTRA
ncbi:SRPBCC family protein [Haladaptatus pallidirubidus]|uniref:SRPBCC domain-containing protein n=1 Tax=Haladaptatus pallidirubidus TaxID=1008152 RepID=A0AAV3UQ12_9EURY|nr:SRPBCC domain-containing protein [Haladaptatus pallidirubidus]